MIITILDVIYRPVLYLEPNVSESGFLLLCEWNLLTWAQLIELVPSWCPKTGTSFISYAQLSRFHLKTGTESNLRNVVFEIKEKTFDDAHNCDSYIKADV
jgi:hypothetical protein